MKDDNNDVPDFMKDYHQGSGYEGKAHIENLSKQYESARQDFMRDVYPEKAAFQNDWNKLTRQNKQLDPHAATSHIRQEYGEKAKKIATEHGYVEKQPSQKNTAATQQHPQVSRQQFMNDIKVQRQQAQQRQNNQAQSSPQQNKPSMPQMPKKNKPQPQAQAGGERERILGKMKSMQETSKQMTNRQRR